MPGLWELIASKNPDDNIYTNDDYDNYAKLMLKTNALHRNNNPNDNHPKRSSGKKNGIGYLVLFGKIGNSVRQVGLLFRVTLTH